MAPNGSEMSRSTRPSALKRELERATADIHDDGATNSQIEMRERAAEAEAGFVLSAQDSHLEAGLRLHLLEEFVAVGGIAHCARGDDLRALHTELVGERRHPCQRAQRVLNGHFAQLSRLVEPAPNLGAAFISSTTRIVPVGETSAIVWRIEFDPMSIAEMRMSASLPCAGALGLLRVRRGFAEPAMC